MSSKAKKGKKRTKFSDVSKNKDVGTNKKIYSCFNDSEIAEIKSVMKIKDVTGIPLIIAATFLNKLDLIKDLLSEGHNINHTGQNNMTPLMWAIKQKSTEIIDFLLNNGADPTIKTDSGENALILALESKLWDEQSTVDFWKIIKKKTPVDVNLTIKNGHNMLHMVVRREWCELLKLLLNEKPNIDASNMNGVTPLMLACFRNNVEIVEILVEAGADILKEDNHERTPLCYAISSSVKSEVSPLNASEEIITEMRRKNVLVKYLQSRIDMFFSTARKAEVPCATSDILVKIFQFIVQHLKEGILMIVESNFFGTLYEVWDKRLECVPASKFLLEICQEILFYNELSVDYSLKLHKKLNLQFLESNNHKLIFELLKSQLSKLAFDVLLLSLVEEDCWLRELEENCNAVLTFMQDNINTDDTTRNKILKSKRLKLDELLKKLEVVPLTKTEPLELTEEKKKSDQAKKSRRRSKAIKAKMTKMKSAELTKRLILNKKTFPGKPRPNDFTPQSKDKFKIQNPIVSSFQHILQDDETDEKTEETTPKWKGEILNLLKPKHFRFFLDHERLTSSYKQLRSAAENNKCDFLTERSLHVVLDYAKQLLEMIVRKYREYWECDRTCGSCTCAETGEHVPWLINRHLKTMEEKEKKILQELQTSFDLLMKGIKDLAKKDLPRCVRAINVLEATLLNHEIRGIKLSAYVCVSEALNLKCTSVISKVDDVAVLDYVQNVVNDFEEVRTDVEIEIVDNFDNLNFTETYKTLTPTELYLDEQSQISEPPAKNKRKEIESRLNTMANGFHLINSIMSLCEEDNIPHQRYCISDLNHPIRSGCMKSPQYSEISELMPKRLKSQITSLQGSQSFQKKLNGRVRLATKEQRVSYIISAGVNFSAVELGLDFSNQPLAVKRIPRESWVARILKTLVDPLLGLIGNNILHYFACEYDEDELILATPLCKWSMVQYVQLLKQSSAIAMPNLPIVQIVRQFLEGLMMLHKFEIPIVHGNLKPSNIFVDFNGNVKIGEFGIHKALYKIIEAPKSSLIWFAKETLEIYRSSSMVECSLKSDIQVAGMLMYYILSYGKHPFGDEPEEILRNIPRGVPKLNLRNIELRNLLLWMMLGDFNERPNIEQVLSHPFFWSPSKKWMFILCCSGINQNGYLLPINNEKLHRSIEAFSDGYIIEWQEIMRDRFPCLRMVESNTLVGLLKFLKTCHELKVNDSDLSCTILSLFPSVPVALYRILQNTNWLNHSVFMALWEMF